MREKIEHYVFLTFLFLLIPTCTSTAISNRVIATIGVGLNPAGIAITPDGSTAYVANNNDNDVVGQATVSVIDLRRNTVITTISDASFNEPYTITINAAGTLAYVTNSNSNTITIINIATNTVTGTITGFDGPSGMVITPDGSTAYVNNYGAGYPEPSGDGATVSVVNLTTNAIIGPINVGQAPASLAITPNGAYVYVINYVSGNIGTGTISVIQTSTNTVVTTIAASLSGPFAIAITPNGQYAYITNFGSNNFAPIGAAVSILNLQNNTIVGVIPVGIQPSGIAITPNGHLAYVTNYNTLYLGPDYSDLTPGPGTVNIINLATNKVINPTIAVGASPDAIAISPDGSRAYVTNYSANTVNVIDIYDRMWLNVGP